MGAKLASLGRAIYDSKRREVFGRDGGRWAKVAIFYFFFYIGLAGFFCAMLAVFMAVSPRDRPRYYNRESRMKTRSNPVSPGLGFRPQPNSDNNLISFDKNVDSEDVNAKPRRSYRPYVASLEHYLSVYYKLNSTDENNVLEGSRQNANVVNDNASVDDSEAGAQYKRTFRIKNPGDCTSEKSFGFPQGKPCVLVKMNKIVNFTPTPGSQSSDANVTGICRKSGETSALNIDLLCYGEYPADVDNLGPIRYHSEAGESTSNCGYIDKRRFPYLGKVNRKDVYQAPYVWVQIEKPRPNVLINVLCRAVGSNIYFDKKMGRAITRFQIYLHEKSPEK